jgi:hypothetical protein
VQAAAVTVQSAARAMAARRELSLRRQARAATRIQVAACSGQRSTSLLMSAGSNFPMCWKKKGAMACAPGDVELPDDEESRLDLPVLLEAEHCEEAASEAQTGPARPLVGDLYCSRLSCVRCLTCERNNVQANLQRLHEMVDVLQQAVGDAEARAIAAKKAIAEAPPVIKETVVTVEDTEKVNSLHAEVARLKVCHSHQPH